MNRTRGQERLNQKAFDKVARHLLTQGRRSGVDTSVSGWEKEVDPVVAGKLWGMTGFSCLYRHPDGSRCAVGCLIPDNEYDFDLEYRGIPELMEDDRVKCLKGISADLLEKLQIIHDETEPAGWWHALRDLAHEQGLKDTVLYDFV